MPPDFAAAMRRAADLTRARKLTEATRAIKAALSGKAGPADRATPDGAVTRGARSAPGADPRPAADGRHRGPSPERIRRPLGDVVDLLRRTRTTPDGPGSPPGLKLPGSRRPNLQPPAEGARFVTRSFACDAGARNYKLYIPASAGERPRGLVVMLHGCKQDPDDFAAGTRMNEVAESHGLLVAYPGQTGRFNPSACWNWFNPADQRRGAGEPAIIAGITGEVAAEFGLNRQQIFVAGLSAGGAMAAIMVETYPDLYAAAGIHSGLAYGSANDVMSAFAAMRGDAGSGGRGQPAQSGDKAAPVRTIVFQGGADRTVHPSNADRIVEAARRHHAFQPKQQEGRAGGRSYTRTVIAGPDGTPQVEHWAVEGAAHAWSGGDRNGSYADPRGPDASREMVRFFLNEPAHRAS